MDVTQAKTFLAIIESGNFVAASKRVNVSQSTVSARIKSLEQQLGKALFVRTKGGCEMTAAGYQFHRFARSMVRVWEEAKHQVAVPIDYDDTIIVGGQYNLWSRLLLQWVPYFQKQAPQIAVRCEIGMPQELIREMTEGVLDLAVIYSPEQRPGITVEHLMDDRLVLVTANRDVPIEQNYIFIDWGEEFRIAHAAHFPNLHNPGLTLDLGALGINMIINQRASGYFPERVARPHLARGMVSIVPDTPEFSYPAYVVYQHEFSTTSVMDTALTSLREIVAKSASGDIPPPFWA